MTRESNILPPESNKNPLDKLKAAYELLNQYIYKREKQESKFPLRSLFSYLLYIFSKDYRENLNKKRLLDQKRFRELRDVIQTHSPSFTLLEEGPPEQRKLASDVKEAVKKFNQKNTGEISPFKRLIDEGLNPQTVHVPITLHHRLTQQKIVVVSKDFVNQLLSGSLRELSSLEYKPTQNDLDSFKMKAKKLMEEGGLVPESIKDVLKSPIYYKIGEVIKGEKTQSLIEFRLRFARLGYDVEVKGAFLRESKFHSMHSIPIPESFQLIYKYTQTGFPLPELHTGMSLAYWLIPASPLRLEDLGKLVELYEQRNQLAHALFHDEETKIKARGVFKQKKKEFYMHKSEYIEAQKKLCLLTIAAAPQEASLPNTKESVEDFFTSLSTHPFAYEHLAECYHSIIELFLENPYHCVQKAWLEGNESNLSAASPDLRSQTVSLLFKTEVQEALQTVNQKSLAAKDQQELISWNFIRCMGFLFAGAVEAILLLEQSEKFRFKPPMLTDFESMLLAWAFKQMVEFFDHMKGIYTRSLIQQIETDIEIFTSPEEGVYEEFAADIETYYHSRYHESYQ